MATDYAAIREDHRRRYGEDVGEYGVLLVDLYAERTHFIYELLQNAQDAGATRIRFDLVLDRLEVRHNGRLFTEDDVRGICAIGRSGKANDPEQIGRFGIGFKSVYAYTRNPTIHCGSEHFSIKNYVHPYPAEPVAPDDIWSTLQVFPFDHPEVAPKTAFDEISAKLPKLEARTVLFLSNLAELEWATFDGAGGTVLREEPQQTSTSARRVTLVNDKSGDVQCEDWLTISRRFQSPDDPKEHQVDIAFLLKQSEDSGERIVPADDTHLVAYFPTGRETHLGFLAQGPFATTPARDNVHEDSKANRRLVAEIAQLTVDSLQLLRGNGLLDVGLLECLPLDPNAFPEGSFFAPIYHKVRSALLEQPLMPTSDGRHLPATQTRLARGADLRGLFSAPQLGELLGEQQPVAWLSSEISADSTPDLHKYLTGQRNYRNPFEKYPALVDHIELDADGIVRYLDAGFLEKQPDEWIIQLYTWLAGRPALRDQLRRRAIVRLADGRHTEPYGGPPSSPQPQVWLPPPGDTTFPTVKRSIATDPGARKFLEQLGLTEPDVVDDVIESILPRYRDGVSDEYHGDNEKYRQDLRTVSSALNGATGEKRERLQRSLRRTPFVTGRNAATGERRPLTPEELYEPTDDLLVFLDGNQAAWLLDDNCMEHVDCWRELGVKSRYFVKRREPDHYGNVVVADGWGRHERGRDRFDPSYAIEHLDHAVLIPTLERSLLVWNLLMRQHTPLQGVVEHSTRQDYSGSQLRNGVWSPVGQLVTGHAWLPDHNGQWRRPAELSLEDLHPDFPRDEELAKRLDMRSTPFAELATSVGIDADDLQLVLRDPDLLREMVNEARKRAQLAAEHHDVAPSHEEGHTEGAANGEPLNFAEQMRAAFDRPGRTETEESFTDGQAANPARRHAKGVRAIREAQSSEPKRSDRQALVERTEWEARDPHVRQYLLEVYAGRCQICDQTFKKRDGEAYFEARYLVSRTEVRWVDRPGNAVCLCPTCFAKFLHGPVDGPHAVERIAQLAAQAEEFGDGAAVGLRLCGVQVNLTFAQKHLIDIGALLEASEPG